MDIHAVYGWFFRRFRPTRLHLFYRTLGINSQTRVLDIGGTLYWWSLAEKLGLPIPRVVIVNLTPAPADLPPRIRWVCADACELPFQTDSFDVAFSNSLIEHLYTLEGQARFAGEVHRVAGRWWVQTVDFRFPVEPHFLAPFVHWLPLVVRRRFIRWCTPWGWIERPTAERCDEVAREIRILNSAELKRLFPTSCILVERFLALPKSIIAIRDSFQRSAVSDQPGSTSARHG